MPVHGFTSTLHYYWNEILVFSPKRAEFSTFLTPESKAAIVVLFSSLS